MRAVRERGAEKEGIVTASFVLCGHLFDTQLINRVRPRSEWRRSSLQRSVTLTRLESRSTLARICAATFLAPACCTACGATTRSRRSTAVATFEASEVAVCKVSIVAAANVSVCRNNSRLCNLFWVQFPQACPLLAAVQILDLVESHQAGFEVARHVCPGTDSRNPTSGAILTMFRT